MVGILIVLKIGPCLGKRDIILITNKCQNPMCKRLPLIEEVRPGCGFCPFGDHKELSARLTSQRQCRRRWTEKKEEVTRSLRSGCADAVRAASTQWGPEKRGDTHTSQRLCRRRGPRKKRDDTHTSHRLGRRRGRREKTYGTHTSQRLCLRRGAGKKRADTRTWQRLRQRRGGEKSDGTPSSQRLCRRRRAEKNYSLTSQRLYRRKGPEKKT